MTGQYSATASPQNASHVRYGPRRGVTVLPGWPMPARRSRRAMPNATNATQALSTLKRGAAPPGSQYAMARYAARAPESATSSSPDRIASFFIGRQTRNDPATTAVQQAAAAPRLNRWALLPRHARLLRRVRIGSVLFFLRRLRQLRRLRRDGRQLSGRRQRIAADAERTQIRFGEVEHADDVGRQRQNDVGLLGRLLIVREQTADDRDVAETGHALQRRALIVANQPGEHVGLALAQPDDGVDLAVAERREPAESGARDAAHLHPDRQRHVVVMVRARRDVDVDADVLVGERRNRLLRRA